MGSLNSVAIGNHAMQKTMQEKRIIQLSHFFFLKTYIEEFWQFSDFKPHYIKDHTILAYTIQGPLYFLYDHLKKHFLKS